MPVRVCCPSWAAGPGGCAAGPAALALVAEPRPFCVLDPLLRRPRHCCARDWKPSRQSGCSTE
eukprot:5782794-Lingulodinium_polyedra.AAC.1